MCMKNQGRYRHLRVDWVGESSTQVDHAVRRRG